MLRGDGVAAVDRALAILAAWREGDGALPLRELHKRTGLYKSTILRLMASLERAHCVERQPDGTWTLGTALFHWGTLYRRDVLPEPVLAEHMTRLADTSGESAMFWAPNGAHRVCLFRADPERAGAGVTRPGDLRPASEGVSGAVIASRGQGLEDGVVAGPGCNSADELAVSAPVFGTGGALRGALTVLGPFDRLGLRLRDVKPLVRDAAADLSRALGGASPP